MSLSSCKIINLWGGPGASKTTTAHGLFNIMKQLGEKVELVLEYAKELTYEGAVPRLTNQLHILGEQDLRLRRLADHVDYIITDSPLPLGTAYLTDEYRFVEEAALAAYHRYDNWDFRLIRKHPYQNWGRNQTEHEALHLDITIKELFERATGFVDHGGDRDEPARADDEFPQEFVLDGDFLAPWKIATHLGLDGAIADRLTAHAA